MPPWRPSPTSASRSRAASSSPSSGHRAAASPRCCTCAARWSGPAPAGSGSTGAALDTLADDGLTRVRRERLGFVFQFFNLLPTLSLVENIALPLLLAGRRAGGRAGQRAALGRLNWAWRIGSTIRPTQLSGGEMQRAAIARARRARPRAGHRRRADRQSRLGHRRAHPRRAGAAQPRARADAAAGDACGRGRPAADRVVHMRDGRVDRIDVRRPSRITE